ncbi:hypothetical protein ACEQ8H_000239 [Pleosporales sp. CAS-2024a]
MTRNTAKPLKISPTMLPSEFHTTLTGEDLRWETIGLALVLTAAHAQHIHADDSLFKLRDGTKLDKNDFIEDMIQATNDCITLCQTHGAVSDLMVWLLTCNMQLISAHYGDNYHGTYRRMGEIITAMYAVGMHCESEAAGSEPIFLRESRRRMHACVYRYDKIMALFLGRPPMMTWRYSDRRMLLDLSDEDVCSDDPEVLNEAIMGLSIEGWNNHGKIYPASYFRLRCQHAVYKERLLEQSLAGEKDSDVVNNLQLILVELTQFWESLPTQLRYDLQDEGTWKCHGNRVSARLHATYLEHLDMHFQIRRILHRLKQHALSELLSISLKLLTSSLAWPGATGKTEESRSRFGTVFHHFCFPAAGLLALELRRCTIENTPLPNTVSRADVIRNLSVLTSCLEWVVMPGDGNARLCTELNKMLAMVLDEVLNYEPPLPNVNGDADAFAAGTSGAGFFDMPPTEGLEPIPTEAEDFLNWLDNASWGNNVTLF